MRGAERFHGARVRSRWQKGVPGLARLSLQSCWTWNGAESIKAQRTKSVELNYSVDRQVRQKWKRRLEASPDCRHVY